MNNGWIKLYRKSKDHPLMKDFTAWGVFTWILLSVDKDTGEVTTGRFWVSQELGINPSTFYKALRRLEKKYMVVTLISNNKNTTIRVLNWDKYQQKKETVTQVDNIKNKENVDNLGITQNEIENPGFSNTSKQLQKDTSGNNKVTTKEQQSNTIQEYKNKRNKEILLRNSETENNAVSKTYGNPDINEAKRYFLEKMAIPKEDCPQKQSRQYWYLLLRESGNDISKVKWLIDQASIDDFYRNNITSGKNLYFNRIKILARKRGKKEMIGYV